jgi:uncharacterized protein YyaL (SSP411 family)
MPDIDEQLREALEAKGPDYIPRTGHLLANGQPEYINRLILEDSPYLLQHAHNPVDWHAWDTETFEKAKEEDKPVFLSIGYSTCHWCHVMEHESFENPEIACFLNSNFISIKVDRELLPDVDAYYMAAVMLTSGHGGWPMSSFLTPDGKPFFSGTYFPPGQFFALLQRAHQVWRNQRNDILQQADQITAEVKRIMASKREAHTIDNSIISQAVTNILAHYDKFEGGFGQAPKFPNEPYLFLLLESATRTDNKEALAAVEHSLNAMAQGGIYDQIGGGFHRYSTDNHWLVPHFEKMLYNQANLARIYLQAYQITGKSEYAYIARETLDYILREMTSSKGAFYSATDADSEGEEGTYFLWRPDEIEKTLNPEEMALAIDLYNITPGGNFEGKNILYLPVSLKDYAKKNNKHLPTFINRLAELKKKMRLLRNKRPAPIRDEKVITAWNGMMISAFSIAASILDEPRYQVAAINAANYILANNQHDSGLLSRASLDSYSSIEARQEDYAYIAEAFINLYDNTNQSYWLDRAENTAQEMINQFWDSEAGGFYMNADSNETPLPTRPKEANDSAIPSGNSVALCVLTKLASRTGKDIYFNHAEATLAAFSGEIKQKPFAYTYMLACTDEFLNGEQKPRVYGGKGRVVATAAIDPNSHDKLIVKIKIAPGWHINAHEPFDNKLIATEIGVDRKQSDWQLHQIEYPSPQIKKLDYQQDSLAIYEEIIEIRAMLTKPNGSDSALVKSIPVHLIIQACNDKFCLAPETLVLRIFPVQLSSEEGDDKK